MKERRNSTHNTVFLSSLWFIPSSLLPSCVCNHFLQPPEVMCEVWRSLWSICAVGPLVCKDSLTDPVSLFFLPCLLLPFSATLLIAPHQQYLNLCWPWLALVSLYNLFYYIFNIEQHSIKRINLDFELNGGIHLP